MGSVVPIGSGIPQHLSDEAKRLWRDLSRDYELSDAAAQAVLRSLCETLDWMRTCQEAIKQQGMTVPGSRRGTRRPHPLLKEVTEARRHMLACFRALNLDLSPPD
jgi:P27 family predicted phage terminase small subunit